MLLAKRMNLGVTVLLILFGLTCVLVLPVLPVSRAANASRATIQKMAGSGLDAARHAAMEKLYSQLKAGDQFSEEEGKILQAFAAGGAITNLEADLVISRALFDYYIAGKELTKEQQELFDQYSRFVARRSIDVADLKTQLLNKRIAAAAAAPPRTTPLVAPPNDLCGGAEVIPAAGPFPHLTAITADITDATETGDPPIPSCPPMPTVSRSIWYTFTPSTTATYIISNCVDAPTGTTVEDPVMAIYTSAGGCAGPFTEIPTAGASDGCSDDDCVSEALQSIITTQLNSGTQYYIVVWIFGTAPPVAGETAVQLRVSQVVAPANDTCASPAVLSLNTPVNGGTFAASDDYQLSGAACFTGVGQIATTAGGRDVVYSFTAPTAGNYSFRVTRYENSASNLVLYVATTCPAASGVPVTVGTCVKAANRNATTAEEVNCVALTAAQQVFIFVDEAVVSADGSNFNIEVNRCDSETEPNGTPGTANMPALGGTGSINPLNDVDFYTLGSVSSGSRVFALVDAVSGNSTDLDMRVTTTVDTLEHDDGNADAAFGTLSANVAGTPVPAGAGTIFLRVNHSLGSVSEPHRLYFFVQPPGANPLPNCPAQTTSATAESEPNDTTGTANSAVNKYFSGTLTTPEPSTDVDVFSFTANAGELIFVSLDADPCRDATPLNARLELLDSGGATLVSVNDTASTSNNTSGAGSLTSTTPNSPAEALTWRATTTGTYFARVSAGVASNVPSGAGDYLLSIFTGGPTAAKFNNDSISSAASATRFDDGVSLTWRTGFEVDNLGFNVYRDDNGKRTRVNSQLIAGSALMVGAGTSLGAGKSYAWFDGGSPGRSAQYLIEAVDLDGESTWYGPVSSNQATGRAGAGAQALSPTLGQLGKSNPQESQTTRVDRRATIRTGSGVSIQGLMGVHSAAKLAVKSEGLYRVTQPELAAAGFNTNVDPRYLRLVVDGQEQAISVISKGSFDASSAIEFYGLGVDSANTDEHVYWLTVGSQPGKRIQSISAHSNHAQRQSFLSSVELKQRTIYFAGLRNGDKENFFGALIARDPVDQMLALQHADATTASGAMLEVALQGVTMTGHRVEVQINGSRAGEVVFNGQDAGFARLPVAQSLLRDGTNIVRLAALGGPADVSLSDYTRITYWHTFVADNNELRFNASPKQVINIDGFSNASVRVFDVTNPGAPLEILGTIKPGKSGYSVTISVPGSGTRTLVAMTSDAAKRAAHIALDRVSNWRQSSNAANLVIFTRREFMMAFDPLVALRQSQGYKVAMVDIEDAYDEFSFGNKTPQAIREFLSHARSNWKIAPRFVMLAGDASFDPKNYLGFGWNDLVPTRLIDTQLLETGSDDSLVDFNGDGLAEMAVGRLPIRSPQEAAIVTAKIVRYDQASRSEGVLLVADERLDGVEFEGTSAELRSVIPGAHRIEEINRGDLDPATAKSRLLDAINRGQRVINYNGHGNVNSWRGGLLTAEDVSGLSNGDNLSLFVMMTCLNGYFHDAQFESLAELLLRAENGGAIALWASSGMTPPGDQGVMDIEMFRLMFDSNNSLTLGEIALQAKAKGLNKDARLSWVLFGDPTTRLR